MIKLVFGSYGLARRLVKTRVNAVKILGVDAYFTLCCSN